MVHATGNKGTFLNHQEELIIYCRNMILLVLSVFLGGQTLLGILISWREATRYNASHRFIYSMMVILLVIEILKTVAWIIDVNIVAAIGSVLPSMHLSVERGDKLCYPVSLCAFLLDIMIFTWHTSMAYFIWAWIVRRRDVNMLLCRLWHALAVCMVLSALVIVAPIVNKNLGLYDHTGCYVRHTWSEVSHQYMLGVMLNRMVILPSCWLLILVLNIWTVQHLRMESRRYCALSSVRNLQVRLLVLTTIFPVVWFLQYLPLYMRKRTLALELGFRWAYGIGFCDALIFGYPTLVFFFCRPAPQRVLDVSMLRWVHRRRQQSQEGLPTRFRAKSVWEMIMPSPPSGPSPQPWTMPSFRVELPVHFPPPRT